MARTPSAAAALAGFSHRTTVRSRSVPGGAVAGGFLGAVYLLGAEGEDTMQVSIGDVCGWSISAADLAKYSLAAIRTHLAAGVGAAFMALAPLHCVLAADSGPGSYSVAKRIQWVAGTDRQRAALARSQARDLTAGEFNFSLVDLDDDGKAEIIVQAASSTYCGSGGCSTVVLQSVAGRSVLLYQGNLPGSIGVTQQKLDGYHLLAAIDSSGAIVRTNRSSATFPQGAQLVYALHGKSAGQTQTSTQTPGSAASAPAPTGSAPEGGRGPDVLGLRVGMSVPKAVDILRSKFNPNSITQITAQLTFQSADGRVGYVPGKAVQRMDASGVNGSISLTFGGFAGNERLLSVMRSERFPPNTQPTYGALMSAISQKYGPPSYRRGSHTLSTEILGWGVDERGGSFELGSANFEKWCMRPLGTGGTPWAPLSFGDSWLSNYIAYCGAQTLLVGKIQFATDYRDSESLVSSYFVALVGAAETLSTDKQSREAVRIAQEKDREEATRQAKRNKPDL